MTDNDISIPRVGADHDEVLVGTIEVRDVLAQGGMGEVFVGWDRRLQRKVALKAVRRDRLNEEARARLLREARILSSLEDRRICLLYDYVEAQDVEAQDNDWLVMELLEGETLSEVDIAALPLRQRLALAQELAEVLVETHAKGIVHRDLKPANLMLMPDGGLKVLDFGIARIDADPLEKENVAVSPHATPEVETRFGELLGTLHYMSPEQALGERASEAADLYAFGLILREWLSGEPPYPPNASPALLLSQLGRGERPDPSAGGRLGGAMAQLVDELTDFDPERRPSAAMAARRIAWQRGEGKRRRRRYVATAAVLAMLAAGLLFTLELRRTLNRSLDAQVEAEESRDEAQELADYLVGLFAPAAAHLEPSGTDPPPSDRGPDGASPRALTARTILENGALHLDQELGDRPRLRAAVALTLGEVYEGLGEYERSQELLRKSLELRRRDSERPLELAATLNALGKSQRIGGNYDDAVAAFEEALTLRLAHLGEEHQDVADTINGLAIVKRYQGRFDDAEALYLRSLAIREKVFGPEDPIVAKSLNNLGLLYYYQSKYEASEAMHRRTLKIKEATLEPNHPSLARSLNNLANLLTDLGRFDEAESLYQRHYEIWAEVAGPRHPEATSALANLGLLYEESNRFEKAEDYLRRAIDVHEETLGPQHPAYGSGLSSIGYLYVLWRRLDEARTSLDESFAVLSRALPEDHPELGLTLARIAALELGEGRENAARPKAERALEIYRQAWGPSDPNLAFPLYLLALCDLARNDRDGASQHLDDALQLFASVAPGIVKLEEQARKIRKLHRHIEETKFFDATRVSEIVAPGWHPGEEEEPF